MSDPIFWGGLNKSTPTKVSDRLPKNIFCENVPMSVPKGVLNIKTCCDFFITQFQHFGKVSAPFENIFDRKKFRPHPLTYLIRGIQDFLQADQVGPGI